MARSLVETTAVTVGFTESIRAAVEKQDAVGVNDALKGLMFSARNDYFLALPGGHQSDNVLKFIDRMDRQFFRKQRATIRVAYGRVSEFVHPNHMGVFVLYSDDSPEKGSVFGERRHKRLLVGDYISMTLMNIEIVELAAEQFEQIRMPLLKLCRGQEAPI